MRGRGWVTRLTPTSIIPSSCSLSCPFVSSSPQTVTIGDKKEVMDPFNFTLPLSTESVDMTLTFHGHYREPPLALTYTPGDGTCFYRLEFDVTSAHWHQLLVKGK